MATTITGTTIDVNTAVLNRLSTDGTIVDLQKDGTSVGSIGSRAGVVSTIILNPASGNGAGLSGGTKTIVPADEAGIIDNDISLGISSHRFKDLYLSGGVYLGGTGAANKLDDYEEGTWTPVYTSTGATWTYESQYGSYVKVGGFVYAQFYFRATPSGTTSNTVTLTNLPFVSANLSANAQSGGAIWFSGSVDIQPLVGNDVSVANFWIKGGTNQATAANVSGKYLVGTFTYRAT